LRVTEAFCLPGSAANSCF